MLKPSLLYIHNQNIQSISSGGLNTTLLQVFSMCNAFVSFGNIVTLAMEGDDSFDDDLKLFINQSFNEDILFSVVHWGKRYNQRLLNRVLVKSQIIKIAKNINPDLIFTREPYILSDLVKLNKPLIFESHSTKLHNRISFFHRYLKNKVIKTSVNPNFKCLFSISKSLSLYWQQQGIPKEKLLYCHNGFDNSIFKKTENKNKTREKLNLPKDKKIAIYTGGLYPNREIQNIIFLAKEFPNTYFLIIGGPEKNRKYYQSVAQKKSAVNISFLGFVEHKLIPKYLYASDILLALWSSKVPTINYCSPLKLFEYMAAGRLILAHDFPTIKEVLVDNVDAIFCNPDDVNSLKKKFSLALKKIDILSFGTNARKKAFELYTWEMRVKKLMDFILQTD